MEEAKQRRKEEISSESESEEERDEEELAMDVEGGEEEIRVEFEGFAMSDEDFDGIRQLLVQLLSSVCTINISQLTNSLIAQNYIGTVLKQSELPSTGSGDDDVTDDVYALVTCYSLTRTRTELCNAVCQHLLSKCKASKAAKDVKTMFKELMEKNTSCADGRVASCETRVGFLVNERFINVPAQASLPMFEKLVSEISEAATHRHNRVRHDFTHYVIISKVSREFATVRATTTSSRDNTEKSAVFHINPEDEFFAEHAIVSFDYDLTGDGDDVVTRTRRVMVVTSDGLDRVMTQMRAELANTS